MTQQQTREDELGRLLPPDSALPEQFVQGLAERDRMLDSLIERLSMLSAKVEYYKYRSNIVADQEITRRSLAADHAFIEQSPPTASRSPFELANDVRHRLERLEHLQKETSAKTCEMVISNFDEQFRRVQAELEHEILRRSDFHRGLLELALEKQSTSFDRLNANLKTDLTRFQEDIELRFDYLFRKLLNSITGLQSELREGNLMASRQLRTIETNILAQTHTIAAVDQRYGQFVRIVAEAIQKLPEVFASQSDSATLSPGLNTLPELLSLHDEAFVHRAYRDILSRKPDPLGFEHYVKRVRSGVRKEAIIDELKSSNEYNLIQRSRKGAPAPAYIESVSRIYQGITTAVRRLMNWQSKSSRKLHSIENAIGASLSGQRRVVNHLSQQAKEAS